MNPRALRRVLDGCQGLLMVVWPLALVLAQAVRAGTGHVAVALGGVTTYCLGEHVYRKLGGYSDYGGPR